MIPEEHHPLEPFIFPEALVLMLGSFPPKKEKWSMDFYYPNLQNDMWRIMGLVFFDDKNYFLEDKIFNRSKIIDFLKEKKIAIGDTAQIVKRHKDNASDQHLEIVQSIDISSILEQMPHCKTILTTGAKATEVILPLFGSYKMPREGESIFNESMTLYRMPSSSRAYPKPIQQKANIYAHVFEKISIK